MKVVVKCCGSCKHFLYECTEGDGWCDIGDIKTYCDLGEDCDRYEEEKEEQL